MQQTTLPSSSSSTSTPPPPPSFAAAANNHDDPHRYYYYYNCVECLTPSCTLFKRYSSQTCVKLTRCASCGNDVDPYIEREMLLVGIDIVLHRISAYRHLLFHREPFSNAVTVIMSEDRYCEDDDDDVLTETNTRRRRRYNTNVFDMKQAIKFTLAVALLDGYLKYEAIRHYYFTRMDAVSGDDIVIPIRFAHLLIASFVEHIMLVIGVYIACYYSSAIINTNHHQQPQPKKQQERYEPETNLHQQQHQQLPSNIFTAVTFPAFAKFVSIFILIWENTPTIRLLGSMFVLSFQYMAVHVVMEQHLFMMNYNSYTNNSSSGSGDGGDPKSTRTRWRIRRVLFGLPLVMGMVLRSIASYGFSNLFAPSIGGYQCSGFDLKLPVLGSVCLT